MPTRRLAHSLLLLLSCTTAACGIAPTQLDDQENDAPVVRVLAVTGAVLGADEVRRRMSGQSSSQEAIEPDSPDEPPAVKVSGIDGFVVPGGGIASVQQGSKPIYEYTYTREHVAVLREFQGHLIRAGWNVTRLDHPSSLAFRVTRSASVVVVMFSKNERGELVISAMGS
jgi:hypothetical protein